MIVNITEIKKEIIRKKEGFEKENKINPKNIYFHRDFMAIFLMILTSEIGSKAKETKSILGMEIHTVDNLRYDFVVGE